MRKYFGTDGIRGIANSDLTPEIAYKVAKASGKFFESFNTSMKPLVLIGRDTRLSGDLIKSAMISGFLSYGVNVVDLGILPTPAVAYLTKELKAGAGVVISASHNPYEYNGIKFFSSKGMKIDDSIEEQIEEIMDSDEIKKYNAKSSKIGTYVYKEELQEKYIDFIANIFKSELNEINTKDFVIGIDTANGATYKVAEEIFKKIGIEYKIINNKPDGKNINDNCGSTHTDEISKFVKENKLSVGFAYDGDGDRCIAIDEKGNAVNGDIVLAIFSKYLKSQNKLKNNTLVATVMSNLGLKKFAKENDINLKQTKVGDRYVLEEMLKNEYNLGGEQSGHIILLDYNPTGDGILTSLMLCLILLKEKMTLSEATSIMKIYPQVLVNAVVSNEKKNQYLEKDEIKEEIENIESEFKDNGRILIRPSGTENLIRVMIEGEDEKYILEKARALAKLIEEKLR